MDLAETPWIPTLRFVLEIAATAAFALSGMIAAARQRMDAVGVDIATAIGMPPIISVMMCVITGVFGGVLRDVLCNEVPQAFSDHRPYALCAFAGGWADVALRHLQAPDWAPLVACVVLTAGLRGLAVWRNWELPAWRV